MSPAVEEMAEFENGLLLLIKNLEFKNVHNDFQMKLLDDIKEIEASNEVFVSVNKSRNIYKMQKDEYNKSFQDKITKICKKSDAKKLKDINFAAKKIILNDRSSLSNP